MFIVSKELCSSTVISDTLETTVELRLAMVDGKETWYLTAGSADVRQMLAVVCSDVVDASSAKAGGGGLILWQSGDCSTAGLVFWISTRCDGEMSALSSAC